jgi:hypothetical protein
MMHVRALAPGDIPAVAGLFQRTLAERGRSTPAGLASYLADLFLRHPWQDPEIASRVYVAGDGRVRGFIGVLPLRLSFHGRLLRGAVAGSLMVDEPAEIPLAGARLLRAVATGPQHLGVSESANRLSQKMWEHASGEVLPFESIDWLRVFHPGRFLLAIARKRFAAAKLLWPAGTLIDRAVQRVEHNPFRHEGERRGRAVEATDDLLLQEIPRLAADYALRPDWDAEILQFVLRHTQFKARHGPITRRLVYGAGNGAPLGCYFYYGGPGQIAWVLQVLARREFVKAVIGALFDETFDNGNVAVTGRAHPRLMPALLQHQSIFFARASTVVRTADQELLAAIRSGDALLTGIAGERWTRLIGDIFS